MNCFDGAIPSQSFTMFLRLLLDLNIIGFDLYSFDFKILPIIVIAISYLIALIGLAQNFLYLFI